MPSKTCVNTRLQPHAAVVLMAFCALVSACSANRRPETRPNSAGAKPIERGTASWYGLKFHGRRTASGQRFDMNELTAAHPSLPFGTLLEVRNVRNGKSVVVRVNDRGPYSKSRILDLSFGAAREIGLVLSGTAPVELFLVKNGGAPPRYTVQVAAFGEEERALALKSELTRYYPETTVRSDGTWSRVQVGAFSDRGRAEDLRRELAAMGMSSIVVAAR
ncbi:MAG TPA: septal ring lytic transglycosylase RlpA family protein [Thermoanaerobaculia bacterium]|nr:septal ring lytic transglycosylase RlpA family protein [Thermoanaerobaculia bacterium]